MPTAACYTLPMRLWHRCRRLLSLLPTLCTCTGVTMLMIMIHACSERRDIPMPISKQDGHADERQAKSELQSLLQDILFEPDQFELTATAKVALRSYAQALLRNPRALILIEGHTRDTSVAENLAIGERRASVAKDFLVTCGVDPSRIDTISFGGCQPDTQGAPDRIHFLVK